jgi:hypothetical protein
MKTTELDSYIKQYQQLYKKYCKESEALEEILIPLLQKKFPKALANKEIAEGWIADLSWRNKKDLFEALETVEKCH